MKPLTAKQQRRFWSKVDRSGPGGCWLWTASRSRCGYGSLTANHRPLLAHRASWHMANGEIPPGLFVCHRCDVPACVNPAHLFLGTAAENNADRDAKDRQCRGERRSAISPKGEERPDARLTTDMVIAMRRQRTEAGTPFATLGRAFGVTGPTAYKIVTRRAWRHVA